MHQDLHDGNGSLQAGSFQTEWFKMDSRYWSVSFGINNTPSI